jgi:hypothetical protein
MRISRSRSVTGKVTEEEYARLEARASPQKISTWARDVLLQALEPISVERELLAELRSAHDSRQCDLRTCERTRHHDRSDARNHRSRRSGEADQGG